MGEPASRVEHKVRCGPSCSVEWKTGKVLGPGARAVRVRGELMARLSDMSKCEHLKSAPIVEGSNTVLVNGLPAARLGVKDRNDASVIEGEPSVLIGGPTFVMPTCVDVIGPPEFRAKMYRELFLVLGTRSGQRWRESIGATGRKVTFEPLSASRLAMHNPRPVCKSDPLLREANWDRKHGGDYTHGDAFNGTGVNSRIEYDPDRYRDDSLFHEMTHADRMANGTMATGMCDNPGGEDDRVRCGERQAVGLSPYDDGSGGGFNERTYRQDRGYDDRPSYGPASNRK